MILLPSSSSVFDLVLSFIAMLTTYQISRGQYLKWKLHVENAMFYLDDNAQGNAFYLLLRWNRYTLWWHVYLFLHSNSEEVEIHGLKYQPWMFPSKAFSTY